MLIDKECKARNALIILGTLGGEKLHYNNINNNIRQIRRLNYATIKLDK